MIANLVVKSLTAISWRFNSELRASVFDLLVFPFDWFELRGVSGGCICGGVCNGDEEGAFLKIVVVVPAWAVDAVLDGEIVGFCGVC